MAALSSVDDPQAKLAHIGESILLIFGAFILASYGVLALNPLISILEETITSTNVTQIAETIVMFSVIMGVTVTYVYAVDTERLIQWARPTTQEIAIIIGGIIVLLVIMLSLDWVLRVVGFSPGTNQAVLEGEDDPTYLLLMILVSLLFVGPAEELLFRGAVQGRLRESWGVWPAILLASLLFGLIHIFAVPGNLGDQLPYALVATLLGVPLGYLYEYTQNILVPSLIHGAYNATIFGFLYLSEIGFFA